MCMPVRIELLESLLRGVHAEYCVLPWYCGAERTMVALRIAACSWKPCAGRLA